jgi:hypothetical protein
MSIKRKNSFDEVQHVDKTREESLHFILLDEVDVFQPYSPLAHEV